MSEPLSASVVDESIPWSVTALRVAALFTILVVGSLGVVTPLAFSRWASSPVFTLGKSFGAGIVLGTAYIHILPAATDALKEARPDVEYPIAGILALAATAMTLVVEQLAAMYFESQHSEGPHSCTTGGECKSDHAVVKDKEGHEMELVPPETPDATPTPDASASPKEQQQQNAATDASAVVVEVGGIHERLRKDKEHSHEHGDHKDHEHKEHEHKEHGHEHEEGDERLAAVGHRLHHHHQHAHQHGPIDTGDDARSFVIAHILEVGIGLHSPPRDPVQHEPLSASVVDESIPWSVTALRVAALFTILVVGSLGVVTPLAFSRWASSPVFTLGKSFGAGIVLGTAYIHILPAATDALKEARPDVEYPIAGILALAATAMTLVVEQLAAMYFESQHSEGPHSCTTGGECKSDHAVVKDKEGHEMELVPPETPDATPTPDASASPKEQQQQNAATDASAVVVEVGGIHERLRKDKEHSHEHGDHKDHEHKEHEHKEHGHEHEEGDERLAAVGHRLHHHHQHAHQHGPIDTGDNARSFVIAHILEVGIGLHSVIIGMALGASTQIGEVRALMIALSFHQFFEGIALGVSVVEAKLSKLKRAFAVLLFTFATPVGIAIGIGLTRNGTEDSNSTVMTQGVLDGISAGILVYMALVDLVSEDFQGSMKRWLRGSMLIALVTGSGVMAIIGLWA
eukprot:m51a1_g14759 putative zinc transporter 4 (687) ;mRNA; r:339492-341885